MNWNNDFFTLLYQEIFMNRSKEEIDFDVELIQKISQKTKCTVVDFCCGVGDILEGFERKGCETYGVDFSAYYVKKANEKHAQKNVVQGDAIVINFNKTFDLSINWFSSFGYFDDNKNQQLLNNIFKHTKTGGKFILEIYNSYDVIRNFKPLLEYEKTYKEEIVKIKRKSNYLINERKLIQNWSFTYQGQTFNYETENQIYFIDEIIKKMEKSGFKNIKVLERSKNIQDFKEASLDSVRLIFIGEK